MSVSRRQWLVVAGCMLIQAVPFGVASNIQPQFISDVVQGEGFSLSAFSLLFTIGTLVSAAVSPGIGYLYGRIDPKRMMLAGVVLSCGGFMLFSRAHSLVAFYLLAAVSQVGVAMMSSIGIPILLNGWFDSDKRGKALGIAFSGGSIGNIFWQSLVAQALAKIGYSQSYQWFGLLGLAVGIPVVLLLIRSPQAAAKNTERSKMPEQAIQWGYTVQEARQERYFWLLLLAFVFMGVYVSALAVQYPAYLKGYLHLTPTVVGAVGSTFAASALLGNVGGGFLLDKLGAVRGMMVAGVLAMIACVAMLATMTVPMLAFVFAICMGLSVFSYMLGPAFLTGALLGRKAYGAILGLVNLSFSLGFASGSTLFGLLVDKGSYTLAWSTMLGCIIVGYSLMFGAMRGLIDRTTTRR